MPASLPTFDDHFELYFRYAAQETVLDIGPGEGKYGAMLRRVQPAARRIAVEIDPAYVERFGLRELYDDVLVMDVARLMDEVSRTFGAVIIGDVIEHLRKSVGTDLLHFLVYHSNVIFVKFPDEWIQDDVDGHAGEAHVSVWSSADFAAFDHVFVTREPMHLAVIRGYRNDTFEWLPPEFMGALGYPNCTAYYQERPERWTKAARRARWRQQCEAKLAALVPSGERIILIDEEKSGLLRDTAMRVPFLERDGQYFGLPADDAAARAELARQLAAGARWVVIPQDSFWMTEFYAGLMRELFTEHRCAFEDASLLVFELRR